jgi:mRNA interferase MazF
MVHGYRLRAGFSLTIEPNESSGLRELSQIMADKPVTVRRPRIAKVIGQLGVEDVRRLNTALAFVLGLAD